MAVEKSRKPSLFLSRLHFGLRFLGLTGALAAAVGFTLIRPAAFADCYAPLTDGNAPTLTRAASALFVGGLMVVLGLLIVEAVVVARVAAGRRSAFGFNAILQVGLATFVLVAVNLFSTGFRIPLPKWLQKEDGSRTDLSMRGHYARFDLTRGRQFSLPPELEERLRQLDPNQQTRIIVYQQHKTFSGVTTKPDRYDYAAERKVVEKIKDLVELLREAGPRFQVDVFDVEDEDRQEKKKPVDGEEADDGAKKRKRDSKIDKMTAKMPELRQALEGATENSIFIAAPDPAHPSRTLVQQMSFNDLFQLDRAASKTDNDERGNLVLLGQGEGRGVRPFANRILNVERRPPRVGVLVVHELLTTEGTEDTFTLAGLRKMLASQGYEVRDIVLKKGWENPRPGLEATADTFEESKLERIEAELESLKEDLDDLVVQEKAQLRGIAEVAPREGEDTPAKLKELTKKYGRNFGGEVTEADRKLLLDLLSRGLASIREELTSKRADEKKLKDDRAKMDLDRIGESRRLTDVKAKLTYAIADCDLLFIPRLTRMANGRAILPRLHRMTPEQAECIKDFMKSGKPVFACLGPINEPPGGRIGMEFGPPGGDDFEGLLNELGFTLSKQTVLFPADGRSFAERRSDPLRSDVKVEIPPIDFDMPAKNAYARVNSADRTDNPLRRSLRVTAHSLGDGFDLRLRFPRPVYFEPKDGRTLAYDPTFLVTKTGWNEERPFVTPDRRPRFTQPTADDPDRDSVDAKRRGPFPVGAAVEVRVPASWGGPKDQKVRVAVIGQGDLFNGPEIGPAKERLFLQTTSWLLGRDDSLPSDEHEWKYPRLEYAQESWGHYLWLWGTGLGLPVVFGFLGVVVLMYRRLR